MFGDGVLASVFDKINQIAIIANNIRFKILLALFNSDVNMGKGQKLGFHSYSFKELQTIVEVKPNDLTYHLDIMKNSDLIEKKEKGYYHISGNGKDILKKFGVTPDLVKKW